MNKEKLHKQVETMNKEQLIVLCKSLIDINCELEDRKDKAIEYIEENKQYIVDKEIYENKLLSILRGEDNE